MSEIIIYTTDVCPKCARLKATLKENNVQFKEADMTSAEALTELRINGVFTSEAPVLQIGDDFLTSDNIFKGSDVDMDVLQNLLN
ncbi:glutaredoxin [Methanohalophilus sp. RSK]|uniref:glutaredoxin family protein n=1 Tax=Methanohalophilus sp. RSK TaxID=2485783 RepID=UPI000F43B37F|nr:glutaredoxin [Methanohalophilus sp. RSK]RNI13705.1 glutaredoxin [Methanohalophilus sp. RSK]